MLENIYSILVKLESELRDIIVDVVFMEGYKWGVKEFTTEEVKENAAEHLSLDQLNKLIDQAGFRQKKTS